MLDSTTFLLPNSWTNFEDVCDVLPENMSSENLISVLEDAFQSGNKSNLDAIAYSEAIKSRWTKAFQYVLDIGIDRNYEIWFLAVWSPVKNFRKTKINMNDYNRCKAELLKSLTVAIANEGDAQINLPLEEMENEAADAENNEPTEVREATVEVEVESSSSNSVPASAIVAEKGAELSCVPKKSISVVA